MFRDNLLSWNQSATLVSSAFATLYSSSTDLLAKNRVVSSAYITNLIKLEEDVRSLIWRINNIGPRREPWDTPVGTGRREEVLLETTYWYLFLR